MIMQLCMEQRLVQDMRIKQCMELVGGATDSIFPRAEAWILAASDHQEAFQFQCPKRRQRYYRSIIDCLFCELYTEFRPACFLYYKDLGPQLRIGLDEEERRRFEVTLLYACKHMLDLYQEKVSTQWEWFCWEVMANAA